VKPPVGPGAVMRHDLCVDFWCHVNLFVCLLNFLPYFPLSFTFFITYLRPYLFNSRLIYVLLPEYARSISRPEVIEGNQTKPGFGIFGSFYVVMYCETRIFCVH